MNNVLSFFFDGAIVQAVKVRTDGVSVTVADARTFPFDEFGDYLATCAEKVCIVCCNPQIFYQDIVHLPPAASKLYDKLLRTEIRNTHPDLSSFSLFYRIIGDVIIDTRPYSKIAVFSYPDDYLTDFIQEVSRHSMMISSLYAAPYPIFSMALSTCISDPGQPRIFIASLPGEKLLLVSENNQLEFVRKIPSLESALLPEDAHNINMTVDYCFQSLRVRPFEAVMLNQPELSEELSPLVSVSYRTSLPLQLMNLPPHITQEYLAPVAAALLYVQSPRSGNILPQEYAAFILHKRLLTTAAMVMFVLTLIIAGYLVMNMRSISGMKVEIARVRSELSGSAGELATFRKLDAETNLLKQPLDLVNKRNSSLDPATALAEIKIPESKAYQIKGISIQAGESFLTGQIDGVIESSGFTETQAIFESIMARIVKLPGYTILSSRVDIKLKTFSIQVRYDGSGRQVK